MDAQYDVVVVGGAAAGLTASLYTARQGLKTLVVTKDIGGQALLTNEIQNYPGFAEISGFELMNKFREQAERYGVEFLYDEVVGVKMAEEGCFSVKTRSGDVGTCAVILAFGKTPRDLGVEGEEKFKGKGVSYCAVCDGPLFKGKSVAVVGSGEPALEAANYLSGVCAKVYVAQRTAKPIGRDDLVSTLKSTPNIEFLNSVEVKRINGDTKVRSITLVDASSPKDGREEKVLPVDGVFVEMGYVTRTKFLEGLVELNGLGEVVTDKDGSTSTPGVFAAGDVTDIPYKQAIISAGQGASAGLSAYNYVQKLRGRPVSKADWRSLKPTPTQKPEG
ncbi:MAG: FAD-dependent oxidoreductase [Candidatus Marsarchaeota archaeon]|nr:FAD-dependent oxidoreductase [Candidatus Marsarchaeota archaeon]